MNGSGLHAAALFDVRGKVALITGGQRGIGFMIAKTLVSNGAKVYISSRNRQGDCDAAAAELHAMGPGTCISLPADVASDDACKDLAARLAEKEKALHILWNNAGVTWGEPFESFPESAWLKILNLNVIQVFNLSRACMKLLEAGSKGNMEPSKIINVGSYQGSVAEIGTNNPSYVTSKAAVAHLTRVLAAQTAPAALVTVNCIQPGVFPSKMSNDYFLKDPESAKAASAAHPVGRIGTEEDMGGLALFLSSKASAFLTGQVISTDGGKTTIAMPHDPNWRQSML
jgi:NAD(P)-dependent dehydrogenase (short-subunit alcohol dehydrogenase family)